MFNTKKIKKLEDLLGEMIFKNEELTQTIDKLVNTLDEHEQKLKNIEEIIEKTQQEQKNNMKDSDEPWADFTVEMTDEPGRVKILFDWNKAMITELRRQGFNAPTEEDIISSFFARLISEHGEPMSYEQLEEIRKA